MRVDNTCNSVRAITVKICCCFLILIVMNMSVALAAVDSGTAPLPDNIRIIQPDLALGAQLTKLSGKWVGTLTVSSVRQNVKIDHVLIVEEIIGGMVKLVFSQASFQGYSNYSTSGNIRTEIPGWWKRIRGFWDDEKNQLVVSHYDSDGVFNLAYSLSETGELLAKGSKGGSFLSARLKKDVSNLPKRDLPDENSDSNSVSPR